MWEEGDFSMDEQQLRARLKRAHLTLGLVEHTVPEECNGSDPFISFALIDPTFKTSQSESRYCQTAQYHVKLRAALSGGCLNEMLSQGACYRLPRHATSARALLPP